MSSEQCRKKNLTTKNIYSFFFFFQKTCLFISDLFLDSVLSRHFVFMVEEERVEKVRTK